MKNVIVKDICEVLERFAPLSIQEGYDNCGLQVGDMMMDVSSVLLATDITEAIVDEAIERGSNMIVVHHPLIFKGLKRISGATYVERIVMRCIKNDIAVYACHTNVDKVMNGVSQRMGLKLGLMNMEILMPEIETVGLGCIGDLEKAVPVGEFLSMVKEVFGVSAIKHSVLCKDEVKKVALCGGSGSDFIGTAMAKGADIYITADISYHNYFMTENRMVLADIGHYESEKFTKEIFYEQLTDFFPNFAIHMADGDASPVFWL